VEGKPTGERGKDKKKNGTNGGLLGGRIKTNRKRENQSSYIKGGKKYKSPGQAMDRGQWDRERAAKKKPRPRG